MCPGHEDVCSYDGQCIGGGRCNCPPGLAGARCEMAGRFTHWHAGFIIYISMISGLPKHKFVNKNVIEHIVYQHCTYWPFEKCLEIWNYFMYTYYKSDNLSMTFMIMIRAWILYTFCLCSNYNYATRTSYQQVWTTTTVSFRFMTNAKPCIYIYTVYI